MARDDLFKIINEFRDKYFRFFPKKATELGNHDYDDSLGKWNREGVRERITFLQHYHDLIKESLEIDALVLKNIIDSNLFHLKVLKPYTRPDFFASYALESIDRLIHLLQHADQNEDLESVVNSLVSRVSNFPILFEQSKEWLTRTTPASRNLTLNMVAFFKEFLETDYRAFIRSIKLPNHFSEKLIGVIPFTSESLTRFARFVSTLEIIPTDHPSLRRPGNFIKNLFQQKYSLTYNTSDLLDIASDAIASLKANMMAISGPNINKYYMQLINRNLIYFSKNDLNHYIMGYIKEKADEYISFCKKTKLIPVRRKPLIEWTPLYKRKSSPLASYIPCGPYESLRQQGTLWVCPAPIPLTKKEFFKKKSLYHRQMINSLLIHELIGHHLQFDHISEIEREVFKISSNLTSDEGFALYVEDVFTEEYAKVLPDAQEAEDMVFFQKKAELMRAHRVYIDTSLATGRISLEEAINYFSLQNSIPFDTAKAECEKYYLNPGMASSYMIGKIELMRLRDKLETKFKDSFSLPLFHQGLINYGAIPIPLIQRSMIEKIFRTENIIR